jgi:hypothetical protein
MGYKIKIGVRGRKTSKIFVKNELGNWYTYNWRTSIDAIILDEKDQKDICKILSINDSDIQKLFIEKFNRESDGLNIIKIVRI